jgi:hypothetical protein
MSKIKTIAEAILDARAQELIRQQNLAEIAENIQFEKAKYRVINEYPVLWQALLDEGLEAELFSVLRNDEVMIRFKKPDVAKFDLKVGLAAKGFPFPDFTDHPTDLSGQYDFTQVPESLWLALYNILIRPYDENEND